MLILFFEKLNLRRGPGTQDPAPPGLGTKTVHPFTPLHDATSHETFSCTLERSRWHDLHSIMQTKRLATAKDPPLRTPLP
jgi:hypothetical protein